VRALVQRVTEARVSVDDKVVGEIGAGLCVLVGVTHDDGDATAFNLAAKIWNLRVFDDDLGKMNVPVGERGGEVLVVSQFTLYGATTRGRRPSWHAAAPPEQADRLIGVLATELEALGAKVARGIFQAEMQVALVNDGPVTLMLEV
jgi:D-aminoacyl-tRNA deacylase